MQYTIMFMFQPFTAPYHSIYICICRIVIDQHEKLMMMMTTKTMLWIRMETVYMMKKKIWRNIIESTKQKSTWNNETEAQNCVYDVSNNRISFSSSNGQCHCTRGKKNKELVLTWYTHIARTNTHYMNEPLNCQDCAVILNILQPICDKNEEKRDDAVAAAETAVMFICRLLCGHPFQAS